MNVVPLAFHTIAGQNTQTRPEQERAEWTLRFMGSIDSGLGASDEALFAAVAAGDERAFAMVVDRHVDAVYNHCLRWLRYRPEADDVTSMTFFEAWRKRDRVRFVDESALPWLLSVATNVARNASRSRRRYDRLLARLPRDDVTPDIADEVVQRVTDKEDAARVAAALRRLGHEDQDVVALCDVSGVSYAEAAAALGIPIGTVRSRLSRARARLRKLLDEPPRDTTLDRRQARMISALQRSAPAGMEVARGEQS